MTDRICVALTLLISILLMGVLGGTVNVVTLQHVEEQRLQAVTAELRARLETDLHAGLSLTDNDDAQTMLENAVAHGSMLESVEVDSVDGKVLYSSDRALRGQGVPPSWLEAMRAAPAEWRVSSRGEHNLGTALREASGRIAGYLVSTHQAAQDEDVVTLPTPVLWVAVAAGLLYLLAGRLLESRRLPALEDAEDGRSSVLGPANGNVSPDVTGVIERARDELERVNQDAHRIAGLKS